MENKNLNHAKSTFRDTFNGVRGKEFKSNRANNTGIGKTFEDIVGVEENNNPKKDWDNQIEIKSQRGKTNSKLTLFCKKPENDNALNHIKNTYGTSDESFNDVKTIHTTISAKKYNSYKKKYGFKMNIDRDSEKINVSVRSHTTKELLEDNVVEFSFSDLKESFDNKCSCVAYVNADSRTDANGSEHFTFTEGKFLEGADFDDFLNNMEQGKIVYELRCGTYKSGKKLGNPHDHGSAFRIKKKSIEELFPNHEEI